MLELEQAKPSVDGVGTTTTMLDCLLVRWYVKYALPRTAKVVGDLGTSSGGGIRTAVVCEWEG